MHQLYTNQAITNLESSTLIKTCLQNLNALKEFPLLALNVKTDTFGVPLSPDSDAVLKKLQTAEIEELEKKRITLYAVFANWRNSRCDTKTTI